MADLGCNFTCPVALEIGNKRSVTTRGCRSRNVCFGQYVSIGLICHGFHVLKVEILQFKDDRAFRLLHQEIPQIFVLCIP